MGILLRTASDRVSSVQIIQVRVQNKGKSVRKTRYDGDVSSMMEKTVVEARARKISGCSRLRWVVGAERCSFLSYTHARGCEALGSN